VGDLFGVRSPPRRVLAARRALSGSAHARRRTS